MDLGGEAIEAYREPTPQRHERVERFARGASIVSLALPDLTLSISDVLG